MFVMFRFWSCLRRYGARKRNYNVRAWKSDNKCCFRLPVVCLCFSNLDRLKTTSTQILFDYDAELINNTENKVRFVVSLVRCRKSVMDLVFQSQSKTLNSKVKCILELFPVYVF